MHLVSPQVFCILGGSHNRGKFDRKYQSKSHGKYVKCHHCGKSQEKGKGNKINDSEEMKESQPMKSNVKIKELIVVTHNNDSWNNIVFVSSYFNAHVLLADTDGQMNTWILDSGVCFHVTLHHEWFSDCIGGRHDVVNLGDNYACDCRYWHCAVAILAWFYLHTLACATCTSAQEVLD